MWGIWKEHVTKLKIKEGRNNTTLNLPKTHILGIEILLMSIFVFVTILLYYLYKVSTLQEGQRKSILLTRNILLFAMVRGI